MRIYNPMYKIILFIYTIQEVIYMSENTLKNKVKCGVHNCTYNEDKACNAEALEVNLMDGNDKARISDETCCSTFKDK